MSFINISGKKIYYENYGENNTPVLVYLHGGPGASALKRATQERFMRDMQTADFIRLAEMIPVRLKIRYKN